MGVCFSAAASGRHDYDQDYEYDSDCSGDGTVKVITVGGDLHQYSVPVTAAQVLQSGSSSSSPAAARFVCDSDRLYYEEFIQALDPEEDLVEGQIYFVLPMSRLQRRLTVSEMAGLAVKASLALQKADDEKGGRTRRRRRRRRRMMTRMTRISPGLMGSREEFEGAGTGDDVQVNAKIASGGRSESLRRLRRYPSRRVRKAGQSFRIHLSTIHESDAAAAADTEF